ncbi:MAG: DinB family protein [Acidobacteriota bacterium]
MMTRLLACGFAAAVALSPAVAAAQDNPMMAAAKGQHDLIKGNILKSAEKIPDTLYSFQPTPEVRTMGQLFGHIADSNYAICAAAGGEKPPVSGIEKSKTTKADLQKALADAFAYCDKVIAGMDDKKGAEVIKFFTGMTPRALVLGFNFAHNYEHYGNLVTYMRINKIVPPSSGGN